jgi:putative ABC transport system permease protein
MWRQQLYLLWNRRHGNGLIIAEVCLAAILTFVIASYAIHYSLEMRQSLGFEYENRYLVWVTSGFPSDPNHNQRVGQLLEAARARPDVESATAGGMALFLGWMSRSQWDDGQENEYDAWLNNFELEADDALGLDIVEGRWFDESDRGSEDLKVVVNREFIRHNLEDVADPVGQTFPAPGRRDGEENRQAQIVGVLSAFKQYSALIADRPYMITLTDTDLAVDGRPETNSLLYLIVNKAASAGPSFAGDLTRDLRTMAPDFPIRVESLAKMRADDMARKLRPLRIGALVGGFFLVLVCLGLFGIFWQSVTTRTREVGLKRAVGLSSGKVVGHFIIEHGMLSLVALAIASLLLAHLPVTGWLGFLDWTSFLVTLGVVWVAILVLTALCAAYPAWHASRISPADALHYE